MAAQRWIPIPCRDESSGHALGLPAQGDDARCSERARTVICIVSVWPSRATTGAVDCQCAAANKDVCGAFFFAVAVGVGGGACYTAGPTATLACELELH